MKKNLFFSLLAALVLSLGFAACSNDDNPGGAPEDPDSEHKLITEWNALSYFQHTIVTCDQEGDNFESFAWGTELYPDDPGHLYIGVDTWAEAEKIFNYWIAPNVKPTLLPPSEKALQAGLTDLQGVKQLEVFIKPGETDDVVAELTLSDDSKVKHFYKITFLLNSAWPTNSSSTKWQVGDIVKNVTITDENEIEKKLDDDDEQLDFICIRANGNGVNPWFVATTIHDSYKAGNKSYRPTYHRIRKSYWTPDQSTAEEIRDIMKENWDLIEDVWGDADCGDFPDGSGSIPFIDSCDTNPDNSKHYYKYNFDDGDVTGVKISSGSNFLLNFNNYGSSDIYDGCTVWRGAKDYCSYSNGNSHKDESE